MGAQSRIHFLLMGREDGECWLQALCQNTEAASPPCFFLSRSGKIGYLKMALVLSTNTCLLLLRLFCQLSRRISIMFLKVGSHCPTASRLIVQTLRCLASDTWNQGIWRQGPDTDFQGILGTFKVGRHSCAGEVYHHDIRNRQVRSTLMGLKRWLNG